MITLTADSGALAITGKGCNLRKDGASNSAKAGMSAMGSDLMGAQAALAVTQASLAVTQAALAVAEGDIDTIQSTLPDKTTNASAAISGGTVNGTAIGGTTPAAGAFSSLTVTGDMVLGKTITVGNGAQTINKLTGSVNLAAGATSLVITNNLVTVDSVVMCQVASNDTACLSVQAVVTANTITLYPKAAPAATCKVFFRVSN